MTVSVAITRRGAPSYEGIISLSRITNMIAMMFMNIKFRKKQHLWLHNLSHWLQPHLTDTSPLDF